MSERRSALLPAGALPGETLEDRPASLTRRQLCLGAGALTTLALAGCATSSTPAYVYVNLIESNYQAIDALLTNVRLDPKQPILVGTLVNLDALNESSRLGRLFSEHYATRMTMHGYGIEELKMRENLYIRDEGALLLSREVFELSQSHRAQAVLVGTYANSRNMLYVNLRIVVPTGNIVVAAHDYALPIDGNMRDMLITRMPWAGDKIVR